MGVRERILAIRLLEKHSQNPQVTKPLVNLARLVKKNGP